MSKAAVSLFVAQSAISTSIGNLERTLGTALFVRHRAKGLSLTAEGVTYLAEVRGVLQALEEANLAIDPSRMAGSYEVGCFPTLVPFWMPSAMNDLRERYPDLHTKIREVRDDEIARRLLDRELEVVLAYDLTTHPQLDFVPIATAPPYAVVSVDHPLAARGRVRLGELSESTPLILLDMAGSAQYFRRTLEAAGASTEPVHRLENYEAVRAMVARGHGYTLLNQRPRHDFTYDGYETRTLALEPDLPSLHVGFMIRSSEPLTRKGAAFIRSCHTLAVELGQAVGTVPNLVRAARLDDLDTPASD